MSVQSVQRAVRRGNLVEARRLAWETLIFCDLSAVGRPASSIGRAEDVRAAARRLGIQPIYGWIGHGTWWLNEDVPAIRTMVRRLRAERAAAQPTVPSAAVTAAQGQVERMMAADRSGLLRQILPGAVFVGMGNGTAVPVPLPEPRSWIQRVAAGDLDE